PAPGKKPARAHERRVLSHARGWSRAQALAHLPRQGRVLPQQLALSHQVTLDATADRSANGKTGNRSSGVMQFASRTSLQAIVNCVTNTEDTSGICEPHRRGTTTVIA